MLLIESGEAEHANLVCNVVPCARSAQLFELGAQFLAHGQDAAGHGVEILLPLGVKLGIVQDGADDASAVQRRVGNLGPLQNCELGSHAGDGGACLRTRGSDGVEDTGTLTVEAKVLGKTLGDQQLKALLDKITDGGSVTRKAARSETLVGRVKEGEVVLLADDLGELLPLVQGRVDASRVMGARVQQDDGALGRSLDGRLHAFKVEPLGLLIEVRVLLGGDTYIAENLVMIRPGRVGDVDGAVALEESSEEEGAEMNGTGSGDRLHRRRPLLLKRRRIGAEHQLRGLGGKALDTGNRSILVVELGVVSENLVSLEAQGLTWARLSQSTSRPHRTIFCQDLG